MKFLICTLVACALFVNALSSVVPLALNAPVFYSAVHGAQPIPAVPALSGTHLYRTPLIVPSFVLNAEGTYVAKTPGSEHIASLPGHFTSTSSINLGQAPGINEDKIKDSSSLAPSSVAIHGPAVIPAPLPFNLSPFIVPAPIVLTGEATYVARNLGIEHVAPLPGHNLSALSLNLQPAPGSI